MAAKTMAGIPRDFAPGDQEGEDGSQAGGQQGHTDIELGQDGDQYSGWEHGQELLETQVEYGSYWRAVIGQTADDLLFGLRFCGHSFSFENWAGFCV